MPPQTTFNRLLERHMTLAERDSHRQNTSATSLINALLREAHAARASDLHLCPADDALIVRFRVDGSLHDAHMLPLHVHAEMVTRIKILAGLRTDEHQAPQDGHFRFELAYYSPLFSAIDSPSTTIDVRVSIIPTYHGENAVLRILASHHSLATLASLGFNPHHQAILERALKTPHGMILSTGSTGSGKTSTLYALLQLLNTRTRSIITIEDPVEYAINGITQITVHKQTGLSFAEGLRSILRQDPNVIGIGEIRDSETAALAASAALTGHLVLSTLHTTDAPMALPRLIDLGVEPYLVSSSVHLVVNQRLIRRLCLGCRKKKTFTNGQQEKLALLVRTSPETYRDNLSNIKHHYASKGCEACGGTGTKGRIGVFEIMLVDGVLREAISRNVSAQDLRAIAITQGMEALIVDGIRKAVAGLVSLDDALTLQANP